MKRRCEFTLIVFSKENDKTSRISKTLDEKEQAKTSSDNGKDGGGETKLTH